jgi:hypothetical protein
VKAAASPTIYPNQYYTDFGGGAGNQFKHIFIGSERILTKERWSIQMEVWLTIQTNTYRELKRIMPMLATSFG